jgi:hypothetical protein
MRQDTERQFRQLLEHHDREFLKAATAAARKALTQQEFDLRFQERAWVVVLPIMTTLRSLMHDHGLHAEIVETHCHTDDRGKTVPSSVTFEFHVLTDPETYGFPITTPALAIIAEPANRNVQVHENSILPFLGGHLGVIDTCTLDELTGARVEKHLLAVAQKVLRGTGAN